MVRPRMLATALAAGALAVLLVGCGSDDGDGAGSAASDDAPVHLTGTVTEKGSVDVTDQGSTATVDLELDDSYFAPTFIKAAPGAEVTLRLTNEGSLAHTLTTADGSVDEELKPGDTAEVTVTVPEAGAESFSCRFHGVNGMQGALYSKEGATAGSPADTTAPGGDSGY